MKSTGAAIPPSPPSIVFPSTRPLFTPMSSIVVWLGSASNVLPDMSAPCSPPASVRIDTHGIGGPSAGLAFTLDLMEQFGRNVDRGLRVAVTGTIEPDGCVDQVGGVKQKVIGAHKTKVDVFLVPAGDNAKEARKHAGGVRVIPVESFRQALHALATLAPKR